MHDKFMFQAFLVTMLSFLLVNALLPRRYRHFRRIFLVTETLWLFLIGQSRLSGPQRQLSYRYLTFGVTFLYLYFVHTHEYVGPDTGDDDD